MIKKLLLTFIVLFAGLFISTQASAFDLFGPACTGKAANTATCNQAGGQGTTNPIAGPNGILNTAANIIAIVAGAAAVIIIIASGFSYVTSAGNTEAATKARQRMIGAAIGLVIVALAWAIVSYVTIYIIK